MCVCLRAELGSGRTKEGNAPEGTKKGMCSLTDWVDMQGKGGNKCSQISQGGGGALEGGDLRLVEDSSDHKGAPERVSGRLNPSGRAI